MVFPILVPMMQCHACKGIQICFVTPVRQINLYLLTCFYLSLIQNAMAVYIVINANIRRGLFLRQYSIPDFSTQNLIQVPLCLNCNNIGTWLREITARNLVLIFIPVSKMISFHRNAIYQYRRHLLSVRRDGRCSRIQGNGDRLTRLAGLVWRQFYIFRCRSACLVQNLQLG